jgi:hypothetical protein
MSRTKLSPLSRRLKSAYDTLGTRLSSLSLVLFCLYACQSNPKFEVCGEAGKACIPMAENASEAVKKFQETMAGKWKFVSVTTRDTFHKTGATFINKRANACIGYTGGVQYFVDNQGLVCQMCYQLKEANGEMEIDIDKTAQNKFCLESFQSGTIKCAGDSLVVMSRDSFVIKWTLYRRMNDDGTLKVN